mmetsp:Transcript_1511/g.1483  ORF Transcript_1511/g.1483 Transcript_1511/m.1483 type:complete len:239 (-) Transcript_1511:825-1541(-)
MLGSADFIPLVFFSFFPLPQHFFPQLLHLLNSLLPPIFVRLYLHLDEALEVCFEGLVLLQDDLPHPIDLPLESLSQLFQVIILGNYDFLLFLLFFHFDNFRLFDGDLGLRDDNLFLGGAPFWHLDFILLLDQLQILLLVSLQLFLGFIPFKVIQASHLITISLELQLVVLLFLEELPFLQLLLPLPFFDLVLEHPTQILLFSFSPLILDIIDFHEVVHRSRDGSPRVLQGVLVRVIVS